MYFTYITDHNDPRIYNFRKQHLSQLLRILGKSQYLDTILDAGRGAKTENEVLRLLGVSRSNSGQVLFDCGARWGRFWDGYILVSLNDFEPNISLYISPYQIFGNILIVTFTGIQRMPVDRVSLRSLDWFFREDGVMPLHIQFATDNNLDAIHYTITNNILNRQDEDFLIDFRNQLQKITPQSRIPNDVKTHVNNFIFAGSILDYRNEYKDLYYYKINPAYTYP